MTEQLPVPPIDADVDLRTFDDMPLDVRALRDSDTAAEVSDEAFRAAVMLWCAAWHQIPASSLPNDDQKLARLAGYGRDVRGWKRVREQALRGFKVCNDSKLYHFYMAEKAKRAWAKKNEQKRKANTLWKDHKPLKNNKSRKATASATAEPQHSHGIRREDAPAHATAMPLNRGDLSPPISPPVNASGSGGTLDATPSRTSTTNPTPPSQLGPEYVEVAVPTGAKLKISRWGSVDEIWAPRDCPQTCLTRAQALAMYRDAVEAMELEIPPILKRPQIVQAVA